MPYMSCYIENLLFGVYKSLIYKFYLTGGIVSGILQIAKIKFRFCCYVYWDLKVCLWYKKESYGCFYEKLSSNVKGLRFIWKHKSKG